MEFSHKPVMLDEVIEVLDIKPGGIYVDGTAGGAGHSSAIAERLTTGRLIALDRDSDAVKVASGRLSRFGDRATVIHSNFADFASVLDDMGIEKIDGILLDLGVSSYQLDNAERGFSYVADAPLDMRMDRTSELDAARVVNGYDRDDIVRILRDYGEEKYASRIADRICIEREERPIKTTGELVEIIRAALPDGGRSQNHHPAMRTFQAIRIEVNGELEIIPKTIKCACDRLKTGGVAAIITFHSLEDRLVKETYAELAQGCICPRDFPVCVCGRKPRVELVSRKPIVPGNEELKRNFRSHSAKLRAFRKLAE
ncbi:MAG: 16S rRNA (cytosine(1402)-N(4))-methyltransferase RsmH [Clostridia bacterium]|nr:16S rRNA (cytosine(1402)-N(4))-methyltransferase RsmH [Clostridia bacterium]